MRFLYLVVACVISSCNCFANTIVSSDGDFKITSVVPAEGKLKICMQDGSCQIFPSAQQDPHSLFVRYGWDWFFDECRTFSALNDLNLYGSFIPTIAAPQVGFWKSLALDAAMAAFTNNGDKIYPEESTEKIDRAKKITDYLFKPDNKEHALQGKTLFTYVATVNACASRLSERELYRVQHECLAGCHQRVPK